MPLPAALLARLKRRGIIQEDVNEEVIAENYDAELSSNATKRVRDDAASERNRAGAPACPNKYNPYHYCVPFCYEHWKDGIDEKTLPKKYLEERAKILKKYPLPSGWKEVYDSGCGRHYYWYARTDEVSWLPPRHPLAVIGDAAPKVSKELFEKRENTNGIGVDNVNVEKIDEGEHNEKATNNIETGNVEGERFSLPLLSASSSSFKSKRKGSTDDGKIYERTSSESDSDERTIELNDRDKLKRAKRKGIDPMDPAAYGDNVAVGTWSSGLNAYERTGADVTASGPLFQQRPYPAPGAVLRKQQHERERDK